MGMIVPHSWADRGWAQRVQDLLRTDPTRTDATGMDRASTWQLETLDGKYLQHTLGYLRIPR